MKLEFTDKDFVEVGDQYTQALCRKIANNRLAEMLAEREEENRSLKDDNERLIGEMAEYTASQRIRIAALEGALLLLKNAYGFMQAEKARYGWNSNEYINAATAVESAVQEAIDTFGEKR